MDMIAVRFVARWCIGMPKHWAHITTGVFRGSPEQPKLQVPQGVNRTPLFDWLICFYAQQHEFTLHSHTPPLIRTPSLSGSLTTPRSLSPPVVQKGTGPKTSHAQPIASPFPQCISPAQPLCLGWFIRIWGCVAFCRTPPPPVAEGVLRPREPFGAEGRVLPHSSGAPPPSPPPPPPNASAVVDGVGGDRDVASATLKAQAKPAPGGRGCGGAEGMPCRAGGVQCRGHTSGTSHRSSARLSTASIETSLRIVCSSAVWAVAFRYASFVCTSSLTFLRPPQTALESPSGGHMDVLPGQNSGGSQAPAEERHAPVWYVAAGHAMDRPSQRGTFRQEYTALTWPDRGREGRRHGGRGGPWPHGRSCHTVTQGRGAAPQPLVHVNAARHLHTPLHSLSSFHQHLRLLAIFVISCYGQFCDVGLPKPIDFFLSFSIFRF